MRELKILFLITVLAVTPVIAEDIFKKIDDDKVAVTVVTQISIKDLISKRSVISARIDEIDRQYRIERSELQASLDKIDFQIKGSVDAGVKLNIDPLDLKNQTVFSAAGSLTGESDIP